MPSELIDDGLVTVNGKAAKPSLKLAPGDKVDITIPPEAPATLEAGKYPSENYL